MSFPSTRLLIFTRADTAGAFLFRPLSVELSLHPGKGFLWVDLSNGKGYTPLWQEHAQHIAAVGRRRFALPWATTDLHVSPLGQRVMLDGRSASLPLFVAWVALLAGQPLPTPFLATGVALEGQEALAPAPLEYLQGKLAVADAYVRQVYPELGRVPMWVPSGSRWEPSSLRTLEVRPVESLTAAVECILGLKPLSSPAEEGAP